MAVTRVPLSNFAPDQGEQGAGYLLEACNVIPFQGAWLPERGARLYVNGPENPIAAHLHTDGSVFVGTTTGLFRLKPETSSFEDLTRPGGIEVADWDFASYGDVVVAAAGDRFFQAWKPGDETFTNGAGTAQDPGFKPQAARVMVLGDRAVMADFRGTEADITGAAGDICPPETLFWVSATGRIDLWSTPQESPGDRTGYVPLFDDAGPVTALSGGMEKGYAFKSTRIYEVFDGGQWGLAFGSPVVGQGTTQPKSVVRLGQDVYFWGIRGPARLRGRNVTEFASQRFWRSLAEPGNLWPVAQNLNIRHSGDSPIHGAWCGRTGTVYWAYNAQGGPVMIALDVETGELSVLDRSLWKESGVPSNGVGFLVSDNSTGPFVPMGGVLLGLPDGRVLAGGTETGGVASPWEGDPKWVTPYSEISQGRRTVVQGVRLDHLGTQFGETNGDIEVEVTVRTRMEWYGESHETSATWKPTDPLDNAANAEGFVRLPDAVAGRWHQFEVRIGGTVSRVSPYIDVEYDLGGDQ